MADEQSSAFFAPMEDDPAMVSEEPILMAPAPDMADFAAPPTIDAGYVGEIDAAAEETAVQWTEDNGAILLGDAPMETPIEEQIFGTTDPFETPSEAPLMTEDNLPEPEAAEPDETTPMAKWNQEWTVTLRERKDAENAAKGEHVNAAQAELERFQTEREVKRETKMTNNRSDEQEKLEAIEADLENDNSWQRVVKMVELNHDAAEGSLDVSRMKDVMIFLKNEPSRAIALA
eukprot:CAMPEP_0197824404 /NCGR_PEP_ID=MMETSP1437-20131217/1654_1 /TAXON_ID=49252 ORGANISM="Eucampia antarctica, Strain CCMP1452" /NCGR_SAMPLE_ID=MMETSP1437 /ASSEMBLY_ACC=CAM_ASM_001096 /LENGTH=231 /DNA_ID=CAMNT_0043424021 /DNA_START=55 /DNA_END=750 /DNA_ORIENTATION=+